MAGMNQTSSQLASNAAGNYGVNAGNAMMQAGNARANALSSAYKGYGTGISDALGGIVDYGNKISGGRHDADKPAASPHGRASAAACPTASCASGADVAAAAHGKPAS